MAAKINPGTLSRQINGNIEYIYPKTSANLVEFDSEKTVKDIIEEKANSEDVLLKVSQELTLEEVNQVRKNLKLDNYATEEYVEALYKKLNSNTVLGFYCIEDVTIVINGISKIYPANSNVEVSFIEGDVFEIIPTSDNSILALTAFPGALGTFYSWLEGVKQFSNILFDMNPEDMYTKWNQGNQGSYQVQYAQYLNCIFWSDNPYISDVAKRTNYTLYYSSQMPLCYSTIPDNTFKAFYLAFSVTSDPNWGNKVYRDSFAKATWATQVFSYYGARTIGIFGHDDPDFNIVLPKDCRGLMYAATAIENAGTFDAINTTNFGAKSGSWRDAFGQCSSLRNLYIKNLKVNLNISWSPINYNSIYFIISTAANTNAITISVSPYTYNLLGSSDFELAASKNITIELLTSNYVEDRRLSAIDNKADKELVNAHIDNADVHITSEEREKLNNNYSKTEIDTLLADKATAESPIFGGSLGLNPNGELGFAAVSLGYYNKASGMYSFAEGMGTNASGDSSHAEGTGTSATGYGAHAEGAESIASGIASHAEGVDVESQGWGSHAEGQGVVASADGQHAQGRYNIIDTEKEYSHIVGNGTSNNERSNAHTIDWEGNAWFAGDVYVGSTSGTDKDEGSKKLATEEYVNIRVPAWTEEDEGKFLRIVNGVPTWVSIPNAEGREF